MRENISINIGRALFQHCKEVSEIKIGPHAFAKLLITPFSSFNKCLLSAYCVPGPVLGAGDRGVSKAEKASAPMKLTFDGRERTSKQISTKLGSTKYC